MKGKRVATQWIALALMAWAVYVAWPRRMVWMRSSLTGKMYHVRNVPEAQQVADRLAALEQRLRDFLSAAEELAPGDSRLANIRRRWRGTLGEVPDDTDVAYTMGKDAVAVCVRDRQTGQLEPENTTMFVLLHELAHVATDKYGHDKDFWRNMQFLLELAERAGVYTFQNFDTSPSTFCGYDLSSSPLTCLKAGTCASQLQLSVAVPRTK